MRRSALSLALAVSLVVPTVAAAQARPAEPLWKESQGAAAPPDIVRLNDFMHDLTERLKPPLVQIRVRRAAEAQAKGRSSSPMRRTSAGARARASSSARTATWSPTRTWWATPSASRSG